jgi:hypothetical protein
MQNTMHSFFSKSSSPNFFGSGKNSGRASQTKLKQAINPVAD